MDGVDGRRGSISEEFSSGEDFSISSQKIRKIYERMWMKTRKTYGLTQNEIDMLLFLKKHPNIDTAADIASCCSLSRSLVCKSVEALLKIHYLVVQTDKQDRRYLHLKLTDQAIQVLKELETRHARFWEVLMTDVSQEEILIFKKVLGKMRGNLEKVEEDMAQEKKKGEVCI